MRNTLLILAAAALLAAPLAAQGGSDTKGKFYFKKTCKACHAPGTPAKEITPLSKTQAQWRPTSPPASTRRAPRSWTPS